MSRGSRAEGMAALSICQSLLLSLTESGIIEALEAKAILEDAATTHRNAISLETESQAHAAAATIIERIIASDNSVQLRRTSST
jgi:hypothetical protein